jgi:hypothetical protein
MARKDLTEVAGRTKILEANSDGSFLVQVISPGWGSSGYYAAEVLEAAGKAKVWPAGTHMYFNHPSASEAVDRPERDVRDLAATLSEDARWDTDRKALVAEVKPVGLGKTVLADEAYRKAIACSVRAAADIAIGEAEGRKGAIVQEIFPDTFNSVDFVTHAGRGGMILESARREMPAAELEADHVSVWEASANDLERALQDAVSSAYADHESNTYAWMRDYDPDAKVAYFELSTDGKCATYQQAYTVADSGEPSLSGDRVEVQIRTQYIPVAAEAAPPIVQRPPAGQSNTTRENTMPENEGATTSIEESTRRELEEKASRLPVVEAKLLSETERADKAEQALAVEKAKEYARDFGTKRVREANSELDPAAVEKVLSEAMREIPLTEADKAADRRLDTELFGKRVDDARVAEETYLATVIKNRGGSVQGLGQTDAGKTDVTEAQLDNIVAGAFGSTRVKGA